MGTNLADITPLVDDMEEDVDDNQAATDPIHQNCCKPINNKEQSTGDDIETNKSGEAQPPPDQNANNDEREKEHKEHLVSNSNDADTTDGQRDTSTPEDTTDAPEQEEGDDKSDGETPTEQEEPPNGTSTDAQDVQPPRQAAGHRHPVTGERTTTHTQGWTMAMVGLE